MLLKYATVIKYSTYVELLCYIDYKFKIKLVQQHKMRRPLVNIQIQKLMVNVKMELYIIKSLRDKSVTLPPSGGLWQNWSVPTKIEKPDTKTFSEFETFYYKCRFLGMKNRMKNCELKLCLYFIYKSMSPWLTSWTGVLTV